MKTYFKAVGRLHLHFSWVKQVQGQSASTTLCNMQPKKLTNKSQVIPTDVICILHILISSGKAKGLCWSLNTQVLLRDILRTDAATSHRIVYIRWCHFSNGFESSVSVALIRVILSTVNILLWSRISMRRKLPRRCPGKNWTTIVNLKIVLWFNCNSCFTVQVSDLVGINCWSLSWVHSETVSMLTGILWVLGHWWHMCSAAGYMMKYDSFACCSKLVNIYTLYQYWLVWDIHCSIITFWDI